MATLDSRLARLSTAQQRLAAALQTISAELEIEFQGVAFPREADEPMKRVLLMEQYAEWVEAIAEELTSEDDGEIDMAKKASRGRTKSGKKR